MPGLIRGAMNTDTPLTLRPQAILFDLDGTLVDSEAQVAEVLAQVLAARGRALSPAERRFVIGHAWGDIYAFLLQHGPVPMSLKEMEHEVFATRLRALREGRAGEAGVRELPG